MSKAEYNRQYRLKKKVGAKLKSDSAKIVLRQESNNKRVKLYGVYHQVQAWLSNQLDPKRLDRIIVRSVVCTNCQGQSCFNIEPITTDKNSCDINEDITDAPLFLEQCTEI
ncbi:hypothetical protein PV326_009662 [Microctonus aethiopoides]|nr:hypothetical protein PV326_009662 [Microctonus aethiopoides]